LRSREACCRSARSFWPRSLVRGERCVDQQEPWRTVKNRIEQPPENQRPVPKAQLRLADLVHDRL
jgi:hypothetical protein